MKWIVYASLNVGLDHWKLSLALTEDFAPSLATYSAQSDLANCVMAILGGLIYDSLTAGDAGVLKLYGDLFQASWLARTASLACWGGALSRQSRPSRQRT